ncbi:MAG: hypothetical protein RL154_1686, partial [Pseudomonadota bacterium]
MIRYFFIIFLLAIKAITAPLNVSHEVINQSLLEYSSIFVDSNTSIEYNQIKKIQSKFEQIDAKYIALGYSSHQTAWLTFELNNTTEQDIKRFLHIDNPFLDNVTIYDEHGEIGEIGEFFRQPFDGLIEFYYPLALKPNELKTYYIKVSSDNDDISFHMTLESSKIMWQNAIKKQLILTIFFVIIFTLAIYNIFLFLFIKQKVYIYLAMFLLFTIFNGISYTGMIILPMGYLGASTDLIYQWCTFDAFFGVYYTVFTAIFLTLFARKFMNIGRFKKIDFIFKLLLLTICITAIGNSHADYLLGSSMIGMLLIMSYANIVAVYLFIKKEENSFYFLLGTTFGTVGIMLFVLYHAAIFIPKGFHYWYFYESSVTLQALLFSIVL